MAPRSSETRPILCAVLDAPSFAPDPRATALELFDAGVDWIQLRDRDVEADALLSTARGLVEARNAARARNEGARVMVNRRIDVARAAQADGTHLGFDALDTALAARLLPDGALIGASLHSVEEIRSFCAATTSITQRYVHLAPIWDPISKRASRAALGVARLAEACAWGVRVLAQGGIDARTAGEAVHAGAAGVAVTGILQPRATRVERTRALRDALDGEIRPEG